MKVNEQYEAKRLSKLIRRKKHCHLTRPIGSALAIVLVITMAVGIGLAIGEWPVWLIVVAVLLCMLAGLVGEALARAWEERGASDEEVTFANQFMWVLESTMEIDRAWRGDDYAVRVLTILARNASDESIAKVARQSISRLSGPSATSAPLR